MADGASGIQPPSSLLRIGLPPAVGRRRWSLTPGMRQLHAELGDPVDSTEIKNSLECRFVLVGPHARAFGRNPAPRVDIGHLAHNEPGAAKRKTAQMHQMPVIGSAVVRIVLAHW